MKKAGIAILIALFALATFVAANGNTADSELCGAEIARFAWNGEYYEEIKNNQYYNVEILPGSDGQKLFWASDFSIGRVVSNEVCGYQVTTGGEAGNFSVYGVDDIQYVLFCEDSEEYIIPEFGTIAATLLLVAGIGILLFNRRKSK